MWIYCHNLGTIHDKGDNFTSQCFLAWYVNRFCKVCVRGGGGGGGGELCVWGCMCVREGTLTGKMK